MKKKYHRLSLEKVENIYIGNEIDEHFARSCSALLRGIGVKEGEFFLEISGRNEFTVEIEAPEDRNTDVVGQKVKMIIKRDKEPNIKEIGTKSLIKYGDLSVKVGRKEFRINENALLGLYDLNKTRRYSKFLTGMGIGG